MKMENIYKYQADRWCPGADLNHRHADFQSAALPLSYPGTGEGRPSGRVVLAWAHWAVQRFGVKNPKGIICQFRGAFDAVSGSPSMSGSSLLGIR